MGDKITFDYFYGGQEETFSYYRIPRVLFTGQQFKGLSIGAKMLYGLLLDRMYLSSRNGWYDDQGRVYIYYPVEEIEETMGCGHNKAVRLLAELDEVKGIGLIERIRQGLGKPAKIYVKQFTTRAVPDTPRGPAPDSTPQPTGFNRDRQDVSKKDLQGYHNRTSRLLETGRADVPKADGNYKNKNYPYDSYHDLSINPSCRFPVDETERRGIMEELKENIDYPQLATQHSLEDVDELLELTTDVLCSSRPTLRIGSEEVSTGVVKDRFWRLERSHIEYVLDRMKENTRKNQYSRVSADRPVQRPGYAGAFFQAEVQHDLYGNGKEVMVQAASRLILCVPSGDAFPLFESKGGISCQKTRNQKQKHPLFLLMSRNRLSQPRPRAKQPPLPPPQRPRYSEGRSYNQRKGHHSAA